MNLAAPLMLLGLLSIAIPVYLHLTRRQDHEEHPFPSLMFLRRLPFKEKQQRTLRDKSLLALRCLAAALLCFAFATPFFTTNENASSVASRHDRVLLLDTSYSMNIADRFEQMISQAGERIDALDTGERIAIVAFDETARIVTGLTDDASTLKAALESIKPGNLATNLSGGFDTATRLLARGRAARQSILLASDMQASALGSGTHLRMPKDGELEVLRIESPTPPNAAIVNAQIMNGASVGESEVQFVVKNTGESPVTNMKAFAKVDGRFQDLESHSLAAGDQVQINMPLVLASDRPVSIELGVSGDEFETDNVFHLIGAKARVVNVAVVETGIGQQSRFLQAALAQRDSDITLETINANDLAQDDLLKSFDALILLNSDLDNEATQAVERFKNSGGGVLHVAGRDSSSGFGITQTQSASRFEGRSLHISNVAADHALSIKHELSSGGPLGNVSVMSWRDVEISDETRNLLVLGDNIPLLVERTDTPGRELFLATNLNPGWSTLALEPGFVALTRKLVDYLASRTPTRLYVNTGTPVDMTTYLGSLPGGGIWRSLLATRTAVVEGPHGTETVVGSSKSVYIPRDPGLHEIHATGGDSASAPLAVNVPRTESEFAPVETSDLRQRLVHDSAGPDTMTSTSELNDKRSRPLSWYLLAIAGLLFVLESVIGNRLTAQRREATDVT